MYIDFHTHIIPNIDDGAKDTAMSIAMLNAAHNAGAKKVILTPHISSLADYEEFLCLRQEKYEELLSSLEQVNVCYPKLLLGAEVLLDSALSERENARSLCIEGTELLLLELPYTSWNSWYNHEIYNLISKHDIMPVMAHIERYITNPKDIKKLDALISFGVKFQVNASSFLTFSGRRIIRALAAEGLIWAIGSDAHNLTLRSPDISKALKAFDKKFGEGFIEHIYKKTSSLLEDYKIK